MSVRAVRAFVLVVLCALVNPVMASAQIGRGWLERLSGPGPFRGFPVLEIRPICLAKTAEPSVRVQGQTVIDSEEQKHLRKFIRPLRKGAQGTPSAWLTLVGCHFLDTPDKKKSGRRPEAPRAEIGFQFSPLHSGANALEYSAPGEGEPPLDTGINLRTYLFTFDIRITRILDVGAAVGWGTFGSQGELFDSFSRAIGQPMRLTTRPLAILWESKKAETLLIQFDGTRFAGGFSDDDFGAVLGTYDEPGEMLWTWSIKADLTALLWK